MRTPILIAIFLGSALCLFALLCSPRLASAQGLPGCPCEGGFDPRPPERFIQSDEPEPTATMAAPAAQTKTLHMVGVPGRSSRGYKTCGVLDATGFLLFPYYGVVLPLTVVLGRKSVKAIEKARSEALNMVLSYERFIDARLHVRAALYEALAISLLWSVFLGLPFLIPLGHL